MTIQAGFRSPIRFRWVMGTWALVIFIYWTENGEAHKLAQRWAHFASTAPARPINGGASELTEMGQRFFCFGNGDVIPLAIQNALR